MKNRLLNTLAFCALALIAAMPCAAKSYDSDPRVRQAMDELETAKKMLHQTTNETEMALWSRRAALSEKQLENIRRAVEIEHKEKQFSSQRKRSSDYVLREALGTVETDVAQFERDIRSLQGKIRGLKSDRADFDATMAKKKTEDEQSDSESRERARLESKLKNVNAEILARMSALDASELQLRLARDVAAIEQVRQSINLNPRVTVRMIMQRRDSIKEARRAFGEYEQLGQSLAGQGQQAGTDLEIARQKFSQIDEDIDILRERYKMARKARSADGQTLSLRRAVDVAESEKDLMETRIEHLQANAAAIDKAAGLSAQGADLFKAYGSYLADNLSMLKFKYFQRILGPIVLVILLVLVHGAVSRFMLPAFYSKDALFVSRRLSQYILFFLIATVLFSFFMEDLRSIATVLGIVGAAIVIALQDLCSSFAGWFVIVASGKIRIGDRVEIDGNKGDVIDIQILRITLAEVNNWLDTDEHTGRILIIPNSFIFKSHVFNYSYVHNYIWDKVDITVTYETPIRQAYDTLKTALAEETAEEFKAANAGENKMEKQYGLKHALCEPRLDMTLADSGVCFRLLYATRCDTRAVTRNRLMARIADEFAKNKELDFAYPTRRQVVLPPRKG